MSLFYLIEIGVFLVVAALIVGAIVQLQKSSPSQNASKQRKSNEECASKNLKILDSKKASASEKAKAASQLIACSYVLVNVIGNMGGTFNERKHTESFCDSMSPEYFSKLETLVDGQNG